MDLKSLRRWVTLAALGLGLAHGADQDLLFDGGGVYGGPPHPGSNAFSPVPPAYDAPSGVYPATPGPYSGVDSMEPRLGPSSSTLGAGLYEYPKPTAPVYRPHQRARDGVQRFDRPQAAYVQGPRWGEPQRNWAPNAPSLPPSWNSPSQGQNLPRYDVPTLPHRLPGADPPALGAGAPVDRAAPAPWSSGQVYYPGITDMGIAVPDNLSLGYSAGSSSQPQFRPSDRERAAGYGQGPASRNPWSGRVNEQIPQMTAPWRRAAPPQHQGSGREPWNPWALSSPPGATY
jgi:hypothetical protein